MQASEHTGAVSSARGGGRGRETQLGNGFQMCSLGACSDFDRGHPKKQRLGPARAKKAGVKSSRGCGTAMTVCFAQKARGPRGAVIRLLAILVAMRICSADGEEEVAIP